jgi:hypothetical protein
MKGGRGVDGCVGGKRNTGRRALAGEAEDKD